MNRFALMPWLQCAGLKEFRSALLADTKRKAMGGDELASALGVSQKTAWFMLQRLRLALQDDFFGSKLGTNGGEVEVDETFIGGKARNMHVSERKRRITGT